MSDMRVIATGLRFPEGPVAMQDGSVVLVEIERQTVTRVHPDGRTEIVAHTGGGPTGWRSDRTARSTCATMAGSSGERK